jgi:hypothetical protein
MWPYTFKSQFITVTKKSGHQRCDDKGGFTVTYLFLEVDENNQTLGDVGALLSKLVNECYMS